MPLLAQKWTLHNRTSLGKSIWFSTLPVEWCVLGHFEFTCSAKICLTFQEICNFTEKWTFFEINQQGFIFALFYKLFPCTKTLKHTKCTFNMKPRKIVESIFWPCLDIPFLGSHGEGSSKSRPPPQPLNKKLSRSKDL